MLKRKTSRGAFRVMRSKLHIYDFPIRRQAREPRMEERTVPRVPTNPSCVIFHFWERLMPLFQCKWFDVVFLWKNTVQHKHYIHVWQTSICCSAHLCFHWLVGSYMCTCALTGDQTCIPGVRHSNQLRSCLARAWSSSVKIKVNVEFITHLWRIRR